VLELEGFVVERDRLHLEPRRLRLRFAPPASSALVRFIAEAKLSGETLRALVP